MARLTPEQWAAVRKDRESTGTPYRALAKKHGVSDAAISKRAKAEGWAKRMTEGEPDRTSEAGKVTFVVTVTVTVTQEVAPATSSTGRPSEYQAEYAGQA